MYIKLPSMRTLIDISEAQLQQLTQLSKDRKVSRAHLLRCAVARYLHEEVNQSRKDTLGELAGVWADRDIDGLEYQLAMRAEWDREF